MSDKYVAAFLLPKSAEKHLTDSGWEFDSSARLSELLISVLGDAFSTRVCKSYLGMDVFEGRGLKLTAVRDSAGRIENIFAQLRGTKPEELRAVLASASMSDVEVFVPSASS